MTALRAPVELSAAVRALTEPVREIDARRRVYVNRSLRMDSVAAIGFDMDYTIAVYGGTAIDELAFELTARKLVQEYDYPPALAELRYDPEFIIRGLVVDKDRGNLLKLDRFGHVGRAFHGLRELPKEERREVYRGFKMRFTHEQFAFVDTLFSLPEACLYAQIVHHFETVDPTSTRRGEWKVIYNDVRRAIDKVHADDSLKSVIRANRERFIERDTELPAALHKFRSTGKRLFLLTNSAADYTEAVMSYILGPGYAQYPTWRHFFDMVIVSAQKPEFFTERRPFREVSADGKPGAETADVAFERGKLYAGGNLADFERLAGIAGERVLYIGDHIYGDILRSKKSSLWRTAMIVPELEGEIARREALRRQLDRLRACDAARARFDAEVNYQRTRLNGLTRLAEDSHVVMNEADRAALPVLVEAARHELDRAKRQLRAAIAELSELEASIDRSFNARWGMLFKEGSEISRFGYQVEHYACVYTARVSNFLAYSPLQYFRSDRDLLPHERQ